MCSAVLPEHVQQFKLPLLALVSFFSVLLSLVCLTVLVSYFSGESFCFWLIGFLSSSHGVVVMGAESPKR